MRAQEGASTRCCGARCGAARLTSFAEPAGSGIETSEGRHVGRLSQHVHEVADAELLRRSYSTSLGPILMFGETPTTRTRIPILKVGAGQSAPAIALREEPLGFFTHWLGRRSYMCAGNGCPACSEDVGAKWNGVLPVFVTPPQGGRRYIAMIELSTTAYDRLRGLMRMEHLDDLVGVPCEISRKRSKSPLCVEFTQGRTDIEARRLTEQTLRDAVATIYGLPSCLPDMDIENWETDASRAAARLLSNALRSLETLSA